ncbi:hypothetical protein NFI96_000877 [Prochilodus magdalenae]|nr:hypothetical protein NFI96_000877 [Prochilodus magdalenae]
MASPSSNILQVNEPRRYGSTLSLEEKCEQSFFLFYYYRMEDEAVLDRGASFLKHVCDDEEVEAIENSNKRCPPGCSVESELVLCTLKLTMGVDERDKLTIAFPLPGHHTIYIGVHVPKSYRRRRRHRRRTSHKDKKEKVMENASDRSDAENTEEASNSILKPLTTIMEFLSMPVS